MKLLKLFVTAASMLLVALAINVPMHELGHYVVAESYGNSPEFHFFENELSVDENGVQTSAVVLAYVSYFANSPELSTQDAVIAFAGPLMNLLLGILGLGIFLIVRKKNIYAEVAAFVFMIMCFIAFLSNLIPFGVSDGAVIVSALA